MSLSMCICMIVGGKNLPVECTCQVNWINIKVIVGVFGRCEGIAATTMLTEELHIQ